MADQIVKNNFLEALKVLQEFIADTSNMSKVEAAATMLADAFRAGNKAISCGNGGSMCDAMHFAEELTGRYRDDRRAIAAISISDVSHISCVSNDYGYSHVFSRYVNALG